MPACLIQQQAAEWQLESLQADRATAACIQAYICNLVCLPGLKKVGHHNGILCTQKQTGIAEQSGRNKNDPATKISAVTHLIHGVHEKALHDGPEASGSSALVFGNHSNGLHGLGCDVQLGVTHVKLLGVLSGQSILWSDQNLAELLCGELLHIEQHF